MTIPAVHAWMGAMMACGLLAACSDGGGGPSFDELFVDAETLYDEAVSETFTDPGSLPTTGSATYEGLIYLDTAIVDPASNGFDDLVGDLRLGIDFSGWPDAVTGRATNFVGADNEAYGGALTVSNGDLDRSANVFVADLNGNFVAPDGTNYDVEGGMGGSFTGTEHEYVVGGTSGTTCAGGECSSFDGGFVAALD